jgi:demethylmenaquinone methyltransferase/2-methoxy-6-polyprenyl-1,4-benzoquinol methylase
MEYPNFMAQLTGAARATYVQNMFTRIAGKYDLMNRLMTMGQDVGWRKQVVKLAALPSNGRLLDLGTGTGDLAAEAQHTTPTILPVGGDFTLEMMRVGKTDPARCAIRFTGSDALNLPFPDNTFDAVTSGYLMRNVIDVNRAWQEQWRVLKPGGRVVCLDTTPPPRNILYPFINFHLHVIIPTLGRLIAGASDAYTYLPDTTENFLPAEKLAERMTSVGFKNVQFKRLMFGTMAIHWGEK